MRGEERRKSITEKRGVLFEKEVRSEASESDDREGKGKMQSLWWSVKTRAGKKGIDPRYGGGEVPMPWQDSPLTRLILHSIKVKDNPLRPKPS
jgi:hypothetical protein